MVSAYSIELPAATKECFFEDLHTNDKVCGKHVFVLLLRDAEQPILDDCNLPSRRRRAHGH